MSKFETKTGALVPLPGPGQQTNELQALKNNLPMLHLEEKLDYLFASSEHHSTLIHRERLYTDFWGVCAELKEVFGLK